MNIHLVDLQRYWTGRDAKRVLAWTRRMVGQNFSSDNLLVSVADYGGGLTGHVLHSELLRSSATLTNCRIDGDDGSLVFDLYGDRLRLQSGQLGQAVYSLDSSGERQLSSFCGPMADLLLSIEEGREPHVSARRNLSTVRHTLAEVKSAQAGGLWVTL